jgi:carboxymethylenebutenolidase
MPIFHHLAAVATDEGPMPMYVAYPEGPGPFPAVAVISGQPGPSSPEFLGAERLAQHGYVGAVFDLMHRGPTIHSFEEQGPRRRALTDPQTVMDMNAGFDYLKSLPFVQSDNLGIVGFCMGGRVAYMMATMRPDLRAAADLYGGGVLEAMGAPAPIEATANIRCPVLILNGDADTTCTPDEVHRIAAELQRLGKVHEVHFYPKVGHGFMSRGPKEVTEDAWERTLAWFDRYLAREPALARA